MSLEISLADPTAPDIRQMIDAHLEYGDASYPNESCHHLTPEQHQAADVTLFAARDSKAFLGILGLMMLNATTAEIKSMHVLAHARGSGVGMALLAYIIRHAEQSGLQTLYLGTGSRDASAPARKLYERAGFSYCAPYGTYAVDPESVYMKLNVRASE